VFSGVLVSSARALGIPSRQITNINSAHESKQSSPPPNRFRNQIDLLSDDNISFNEQYGGSIWNFHSYANSLLYQILFIIIMRTNKDFVLTD
jgi:hypothetical protein